VKAPIRLDAFEKGQAAEQERIIKLLTDLNAIRRCAATGEFVAFDTHGEKVIYLTGLENK
jgi:hypothetical protein